MPLIKKTGTIHDSVTGFDFRVDEPLKPLKSIRLKCLECCCGNPKEVAKCHIWDCTLWPLRPGFRKKRTSTMSEEQRKAVAIRFQNARASQKSLQQKQSDE